MNLDDQELDILIEALEAWEYKDACMQLMNVMMSTMIIDSLDARQLEEYESKKQEYNDEIELKTKLRKETSTLIKAKLIKFKQDAALKRLEKSE